MKVTSYRELDALVAEKVMNLGEVIWCKYAAVVDDELDELDEFFMKSGQIIECDKSDPKGAPYIKDGTWVARYSQDIQAAWQVVEKMCGDKHWRICSPFRPGDKWFAGITPHFATGWNGRPDTESGADTPMLAISLVALKAIGVDVEWEPTT